MHQGEGGGATYTKRNARRTRPWSDRHRRRIRDILPFFAFLGRWGRRIECEDCDGLMGMGWVGELDGELGGEKVVMSWRDGLLRINLGGFEIGPVGKGRVGSRGYLGCWMLGIGSLEREVLILRKLGGLIWVRVVEGSRVWGVVMLNWKY